MQRTALSRGLAAALALASAAPVAHAVMLDPRGLGQALVFPYYTVNAGQDTLLTVVNTSNVGKAVKVRFREGYNGRETLTFDLFLAAHDTWVGAVSSIDGSAASGARLTSPDHSCISGLASLPYPFSSAAYTGGPPGPGGPSYPKDSGPQTIDRTREGFIEMIAMGDIAPGSPTDLAITPVQTGQPDTGTPPCNLPSSIDLMNDLVAPTSGLAGSGAIANVAEGTFYTYAADALSGFAFAPLITPISGPYEPDLSSAQARPSSHGVVATVFDASGEPLQIEYARGIDAVSAVFMADAIDNEYLISDALGANTDWIITFPTKQFYVDKGLYPSAITFPFDEPFAGGTSHVETWTEDLHDHEAGSAWPGPSYCSGGGSDCVFHSAYLDYQTSVLMFLPLETASGVFGSELATAPLSASFYPADQAWTHADGGWLKLDLAPGNNSAQILTGGKTLEGIDIALPGLPVTGFMAYNIVNSQAAPGRLANYGGTFRHRTHWSCAGALDACE